jgi:flavodoxin-like protein
MTLQNCPAHGREWMEREKGGRNHEPVRFDRERFTRGDESYSPPDAIGAKYKAVKHETMTEAESHVWERIQSLIQRFQNADRIVVGTPMWNFGSSNN